MGDLRSEPSASGAHMGDLRSEPSASGAHMGDLRSEPSASGAHMGDLRSEPSASGAHMEEHAMTTARLALHTWTLDTTPLPEALGVIRRTGWDAVELRRLDFQRAAESGESADRL